VISNEKIALMSGMHTKIGFELIKICYSSVHDIHQKIGGEYICVIYVNIYIHEYRIPSNKLCMNIHIYIYTNKK